MYGYRNGAMGEKESNAASIIKDECKKAERSKKADTSHMLKKLSKAVK